ncbi:MAG: hypothetical protein KA369_05770 [Spirochaetes bacterium]|nr:hypothetical protein [Spirochaetota bacterium]
MTLQKILTKWIIIHGEGGKIEYINDILKYHIKLGIVRNIDEVVLMKPELNDKIRYTIFNAPATSILNVSKTLWDKSKRNDIEIQDYYDKFINYDFNESFSRQSCGKDGTISIEDYMRMKNRQNSNLIDRDTKETNNAYHFIKSGLKSLVKSRTDKPKGCNIENINPLTIQTINKTNIIEIHDDIYRFSIINTDCMALLLRMNFNKTYYQWVNEFLPKIKGRECSEIINVDDEDISFPKNINAHPHYGLYYIEPGFSKLKYIYLFNNERYIPLDKDIDGIQDLINDCLTRVYKHQIKQISISGEWGETDKAGFPINVKELITNKLKLSIRNWLIENQNTNIEDIFIVI